MSDLRFAAPKERRVALVTGGARGIGQASALRLAREGRDLALLDLLPDDGARTIAAIEVLGQRAIYLRADVTDESAVHNAVAQTVAQLGRLDILVCCAGVLGAEVPFLEQTSAEFERVQRINLHGVFYAHQAAVPHMLARGWGRCVTITSGARLGATHVVPYACSKGAVWSLVRALGNAWPRQNVFVNGVEPGRALTDMVVPRFSQDFLDDPPVAIGRYADPEEVAEIVAFLCSERNTYTTGSVWSVKGNSG